jgi:glycosyltransferase involved in cell wall biosynthesis
MTTNSPVRFPAHRAGPGSDRLVALVSFRLGGADGVSVAAAHWAEAFTRLGFQVLTVAGEGRADRILSGLGLHPPKGSLESRQLEAALGEADLVVVENVCSLPLNPEAGRALAESLRGRPAIVHHHDLPWQRARFAHVRDWPPDDPAWVHVTINELSRHELEARGKRATTVYNGFPEEPPGRRAPTRRALRIQPGGLLVLQPTRAIARKNIPAGVAMAEALGATYWLTGPPEEGYGPEAASILNGAGCPVRWGLPEGVTMADAYAAADAVVLPSTWEGFGCPVVESAMHRRPLAVSDYPVAAEIGRFGFRWFPVDDPEPLRTWLQHRDGGLIEHNRAVARSHFSLDALTDRLAEVLRNPALSGLGLPASSGRASGRASTGT